MYQPHAYKCYGLYTNSMAIRYKSYIGVSMFTLLGLYYGVSISM